MAAEGGRKKNPMPSRFLMWIYLKYLLVVIGVAGLVRDHGLRDCMYYGLSMDYLQNSGLSESMYYGLSMDYLQNSGLSENLPKPCFSLIPGLSGLSVSGLSPGLS